MTALGPGVRAVVAFARPCCGNRAHCGAVVVVQEMTTMSEAVRERHPEVGVPIVECGVCKAPVSPDVKIACVTLAGEDLLLHACRLVPLPPDMREMDHRLDAVRYLAPVGSD